ncbi:hypothetical protein Tco_0850240 [Tanacetum coccineum]
MLRVCPHHGFLELTQIDTFYNGLNDNDQDSLNAATGGNLLSKTTREALNIIENKSKVCYSRNKSNVSRVNTTSRESSSKTDERIDKLADQILTLVEIVSKKVVTPATVKAVVGSCVTCSGPHAYYNCPNTDRNQTSVCAATGTYNQVAPPNRASNHMAPPGFASMQNNGQNSTTSSSPSLTLVNTSDAFLEEFADELVLLEPFPPGIGDDDFNPERDILLLEKLLNDDPLSPLPPKELNFKKLKMIKSSIDDFSSINVYAEKSVTFYNPLFVTNKKMMIINAIKEKSQ